MMVVPMQMTWEHMTITHEILLTCMPILQSNVIVNCYAK